MSESDPPAVLSPLGSFSRSELDTDILGLRMLVDPAAEVALVLPDPGLVAAALLALDGWAARVHLLGSGAENAAPDVPRMELLRGAPALSPRAPVVQPEDLGALQLGAPTVATGE